MTEFSVGDKVRIKEDTNLDKSDWFLIKCRDEKVIGEVTEVTTDPDYKDLLFVSARFTIELASDNVLFVMFHVADLELVEND